MSSSPARDRLELEMHAVPPAGDDAEGGDGQPQRFEVFAVADEWRSLGQLTREVPPRAEHYRDFTNSPHAYRPTLDELHEGKYSGKNEIKEEEETLQKKKGKVIKFGWVEGVFMRCLLNIWGVMLFLRLSWVVGQAGIGEGVGVIVVANFVTLLTTISMSAVCTNGQIKGGGIYYMISRSLGPEFGGAIGLMFTLANAIAVSMYIVGFCESLQDLLRGYSLTIVDGDINDIRIVGIITLVAILILALVGMDWVTRTQMILLFVLIAAQIDFIAGSIIGPKSAEERSRGFVGYNMETFKENLWNDYRYYEGVHHNFFSVFSVFFPAVTGIVAGANLSGDLKDPSSSIPLGTLLAIVVTFLSYVGYAFMVGACVLRDATGNETMYPMNVFDNASSVDPLSLINYCANSTCKFGLQNDNQVMELVSWWGPLIYGGCFAAALSSAIASLVGAPRVLQALAKDRLYPFIGFFSVGYGANNDPVRGYILVSLISFGCILIAQLNAIAPLLSNFFLAAYALINFSVFHASISKSPGWRPAFKYYNAWVSLLGTLMCIGVMFLMSWVMALITFVVVVTLYLYVSYRKPDVNWGSSTQAQCYNSALKAMLELNHVEEHVKNFRPQLLVLAGMPGTRPPLIDFAALITKGISLLVCGHVLSGRHSQRVHNALSRKAYLWLRKHKIKAFFDVVDSDNFETGTETLMRTSGLGKLRPNTVLMGYKADWQHCDHDELRNYFNIIHNALDRYLAVGILRLDGGLDYSRVLQDDEFVPISKLDKKDEEEKLRRNQSACQLTQVARDLADLEQTDESSDCDCGPGDAVSADPDPDRDADAGALSSVAADDSPAASASPAGRAANGVSRRMRRWGSQLFLGPTGEPLSPELLARLTRFRQKQPKGYIDVWWLYDDGGLTLLIPYILSTRSQFSGCKLRIFSLASSKNELDREQRNLAALLSKFRIDYSDVVVIPNITQQAQEKTRLEFESLIEKFRINSSNGENSSNANQGIYITDSELFALKEKTNRHMRLRELLLEYSISSTFVVMALPIPRKGVVSAPLYMAWLELLTRGMPPYLILRGNQTSVLTFYC
ncbi:bumetanide-sensitive sodium-(potassium)-chloride cotransporter-like [Schistocerca piceifrons]|uniref:bumetanide-sensitive sodium-(potassium)-chloride cotransporter-like n=1 Tax=Schistocerca piceifrons TaxID=274613 RepID=UPI001F5F5C44|nr:bumetanide-sensitive sodium-(potassium)-chloride cotransporter-like [Schistocerca piceifrons]